MSPKLIFNKTEMSPKLKCHQNWPQLKCHQTWNITKTEISPIFLSIFSLFFLFFLSYSWFFLFFLFFSWFIFCLYFLTWLDMEENITAMINQDNPKSIKTKQDQPRSNQGLSLVFRFSDRYSDIHGFINSILTYWKNIVALKWRETQTI